MFTRTALALLVVVALVQAARGQRVDRNFYARPGVTPAQICRGRGFLAEEHYITTQDGYILKLTRCSNPLLNGGRGLPNRVPLLFIPAIISDPADYLVNAFDAQPKDLTSLSVDSDAAELAKEPAAKSLCFLAMNMGHECWFLHRRGWPGSERKLANPNSFQRSPTFDADYVSLPSGVLLPGLLNTTGRFSTETFRTAPEALIDYGDLVRHIPISLDADFWDFSLDEPAVLDVPPSVDYVLNYTGYANLSLVSHSNGGAIQLIALIEVPGLAVKVSSSILWAPSFAVGRAVGLGGLLEVLRLTEPLFETYTGSFPPSFTQTPLQALLGVVCATGATQRTVCELLFDLLFGLSGGKQPIYPEFLNTVLVGSPSHEFAQIAQALRLGGFVHKYDRGEAGNLAAYNQTTPPPYNLTRIRAGGLSFYVGPTDTYVSPADVDAITARLTVPWKTTRIGTPFNHIGFFTHDDIAELVIVPSMRDIQNPVRN